MEVFSDLGLAGMFCSAFLAATILPLGSEAILVYLLVNHWSAPAVVGTATVGNVLGSLVNYWMGLYGSQWMVQHVSGISKAGLKRARERFASWGKASLLLAWMPVIGDPLTVAAGLLRVNLLLFLFLVTLGKLGRYLVLAGAALSW